MASKKAVAKTPFTTISDLKNTVRDIEYLLISVVQGVALAALAASAGEPVTNLNYFVIPYVLASFLIILTFWTQAVIHTISFIDWPINMPHNALYFVVAFIEVMAFAQIANPFKWFAFLLVFLLSIGLLYKYDLVLIKRQKEKFQMNDATKALYAHIVRRQQFELLVLLPIVVSFVLFSCVLLKLWPEIFIDRKWHLVLIGMYCVVSVFGLFDVFKSFTTRTKLLTAAAQ